MDISKLAQKLAELNENSRSSGGSMDFYNLKDGRNVMRILPPAEGKEMFFEEVWVHYGVGKTPENKKGQMVVCPKTHGEDEPCPVCELVDEYYKLSSKRGDKYSKMAQNLRKKKKVYYNVLPRDDDFDITSFSKNDEGKWINADGEEESPIKVMSSGVLVLKGLLGIIVDPEYGDITDPEEGLDAIITKTGTGFETTYEVKTKRKESPIDFDDWKECLQDLTKLSKCKSYNEILDIMQGKDPDTSDRNDDLDDDLDDDSDIDDDTDNVIEGLDAIEDDDLAADIKAAIARRKNK